MDNKQLCMRCMHESGGLRVCKHCGFIFDPAGVPDTDLKPGALLANRYLIGCAARRAGSMIQYVGMDRQENRRLAVYEYFPPAQAMRGKNGVWPAGDGKQKAFSAGKRDFLKHMRNLAGMRRHAGLAPVYTVWEENGTAYATAFLCEDATLEALLCEHNGMLMPAEALPIALQLCNGLSALHQRGLACQTLSTDMVCISANGSVQLAWYPDLIRTGSRRLAANPSKESTPTPCKDRVYGAASDVYAIGALLYRLLGGDASLAASKPVWRTPSVSTPHELDSILRRALARKPDDRYPSTERLAAALQALLCEPAEGKPAARGRYKGILTAFAVLFFLLGSFFLLQFFRGERMAALQPPVVPSTLTLTPSPNDVVDSDGALPSPDTFTVPSLSPPPVEQDRYRFEIPLWDL
ncbi:MAG: protein kinase [Clostridia bacterium]|nr:protein kinase [Clostridia bacterium]